MGIDPSYYWLEMDLEEVDAVIKGHIEQYRNGWEQTRLIAYNAASGMSKLPTIQKFIPFSWDNESTDESENKTKRKPSKEVMEHIAKNLKINPNGKL